MDSVLGDDIVREGLAAGAVGGRCGIVDRKTGHATEVSVAPGLDRNRIELRGGLVLDGALEGAKEEGLVLLDGSTCCAAKLIPHEGGLGLRNEVKEVPCADGGIAVKLENAAVEQVGASPGDDVEDSATGAAEFSVEVRSGDVHFLQGLSGRNVDGQPQGW